LLREGGWEPFETQVVAKAVNRGDVVLDLGANIGYYTLLFSRLVGEGGKVFAFEPDPDNWALLEKNVAANRCRNVTLVRKAVSDRTGKTRLYLARDNKGDHRIYNSGDGRHSIEIEAIRLDEYFQGYQGAINLVKMDIQGSEIGALRGMGQLLEKHRDLMILSEFWPVGLRRFGTDPRLFLTALREWGFQLYDVNEVKQRIWPTEVEWLVRDNQSEDEFTNLLCVRKGLPPAIGPLVDPGDRAWAEQLRTFGAELAALVPAGNLFILPDYEKVGGAIAPGRHALPFLERDGQCWGRPPDDKTAIRELERLRQSGANYIVFGSSAFWWLDYYAGLNRYLRARFRCVLENDRAIAFDLRDCLGKVEVRAPRSRGGKERD
jgi:FkbM family methyltransferase